MAEPFDVFADAFIISVTPFGANLSFDVRQAHPSQTAPQTTTRLGTVRMSVEHLKLMTMITRNQVKRAEAESGVKYDVPTNILSQLQIPPEDWDTFWK